MGTPGSVWWESAGEQARALARAGQPECAFLTGALVAEPVQGGRGSGEGEGGRLVLQESHSKLEAVRMEMEVRGLSRRLYLLPLCPLGPEAPRCSTSVS